MTQTKQLLTSLDQMQELTLKLQEYVNTGLLEPAETTAYELKEISRQLHSKITSHNIISGTGFRL
jgi:hypothetical protein